jgi:hypothetical protein
MLVSPKAWGGKDMSLSAIVEGFLVGLAVESRRVLRSWHPGRRHTRSVPSLGLLQSDR